MRQSAGSIVLSAALSDYFLVKMRVWERWVCAAAAFLMVAPELISTPIKIGMVVPVLLRCLASLRRAAPATT